MTKGTVGDYLEHARQARHVAARASSPEMADSLMIIAAYWQTKAALAQAEAPAGTLPPTPAAVAAAPRT